LNFSQPKGLIVSPTIFVEVFMSLESRVDRFLKELRHFEYSLQSLDRIWDVIFPVGKTWSHLRVTKYLETFYITHIDGDLPTLEVTSPMKVQELPGYGHSHFRKKNSKEDWGDWIASASRWLAIVKKDWIKAYKQLQASYPLNRRYGIIPSSVVRASLADLYRVDVELGKAKMKQFIALVEGRYFIEDKQWTIGAMTAHDYFEYCKIAYLSSQRKDDNVDPHLSGREMYERYADGRDEGLLEIDEHSKEEFADWIDGKHPKKDTGGHPWEIKRGGNTTHINLCVARPPYNREGFIVKINGPSLGRLKEAVCMFLGIHKAGLPISIEDPGGIRKRLLAQDNIGIVPCFNSLHRANQRFPDHQDVYDVLHYDDLGSCKLRCKPLITWEPLPLLKPTSK
jgi:hypothetical protein